MPIKSLRRNLRISRIRSMVEHPYIFFKGTFHFGHVVATAVQSVRAKTYFTAIYYYIVRARFLGRIA